MKDPWCFSWWQWDEELGDWAYHEVELFEYGGTVQNQVVRRRDASNAPEKPTWVPKGERS